MSTTKPISTDKVIEKLEEAYQLFSNNPDLWVKGALAHDEKGNDVSVGSKKATKFCAIAILQKVCGAKDTHPAYIEGVTQLNVTVGKLYKDKFSSVEDMNDGKTGFKQVLRVYKETIKRLTKQGVADTKAAAKSETPAAE